jgi:hypothetical protein
MADAALPEAARKYFARHGICYKKLLAVYSAVRIMAGTAYGIARGPGEGP